MYDPCCGGWLSLSVTVALKLRDGGSIFPWKWISSSGIYTSSSCGISAVWRYSSGMYIDACGTWINTCFICCAPFVLPKRAQQYISPIVTMGLVVNILSSHRSSLSTLPSVAFRQVAARSSSLSLACSLWSDLIVRLFYTTSRRPAQGFTGLFGLILYLNCCKQKAYGTM